MKSYWHRRMFDLKADPYGVVQGPGILHRLTLRAFEEGKGNFEFSTEIYLPKSMPQKDVELNLQMFEDNGRTQLLKKFDEWRGRDVKKLSFLV